MKGREIIIFGIGAMVGGICGFFLSKFLLEERYHKIADDEIAEMKEYYDNLMKDVKTYEGKAEEKPKSDDTEPDDERTRTSKREKKHLDPVNYAHYFTDPAEEEFPTEDEEELQEMLDADEYHERTMDNDPEEMTESAIGDLPPFFDSQILQFYTEDLVVAEGDSEIIDYERLLGNCLEAGDFTINDDRTIMFVVNYELETIYEIQKVFGAFIDMTPVEEG